MHVRAVDFPSDRSRLLLFLEGDRRGLSESKHAFVARDDDRPGTGLVAEGEGGLVGYVGLAPAQGGDWGMEMVARPEAVSRLVDAALEEVSRRRGRRLRWWVYDPDVERLPPQHGFRAERELLIMGRPLPASSVAFPAGFTLRGFRPRRDEGAWLEVNNAAFAGHPENGDMTRGELERRMSMEWFDPAGLRMAWAGDHLAGFCWTKVHGSGEGEIYIIGVHPDDQGKGLGAALVGEGMRHLGSVGCGRVFLYTEGDNRPAVRLYEKLGFEVERTHRSFLRDAP